MGPYLPEEALAERLRSADLFILPSLEEGLVRTALQAMACGLPVVLTPNTGANDYVDDDINGSIVPIRDSRAIAEAAESWWDKINTGQRIDQSAVAGSLTYERLKYRLCQRLNEIGV